MRANNFSDYFIAPGRTMAFIVEMLGSEPLANGEDSFKIFGTLL